jgi:hypothetical protein
MAKYTNNTGLSLFAQVYLATDHYDFSQAGLSATTLIKPIKQVILAHRVPAEHQIIDVVDNVANRNGSSIHDGFERAWLDPRLQETLVAVNVPEAVAKKVRVNPTQEEVAAGGIIPVYMEQRHSKNILGIKVTGKFDAVVNGEVEDLKNTSTWKYMSGKDEDYILQGSIYRFLAPHIITKDWMNLTFNFTDWSAMQSRIMPGYPPNKMLTKRLQLLSYDETEDYVTRRVGDLIRLKDATEEAMPLCSDKDLWRKEDQYRYYKNPQKAYEPGARSTKNFDNQHDAAVQLSKDGNVGVVIKRSGEVTACKYCSAFMACKQKDALIASGDLIV